MSGPVYPRAFEAKGLDWAIPEEHDRRVIDQIIFMELVNGTFRTESRHLYCNAIERLKEIGCDGVAFVCTEIPLLVTQKDSALPILDSTRLVAKAAFEIGIGDAPLPQWFGGPIATNL